MAIVKISVSSIIKLGLWDRVCEYKDWNVWKDNYGNSMSDEIIEFDDEFKKEGDQGKCINRAMLTGIITLESNDSPNDFEELFQQFIDQYKWNWKGNIDWC